MSRLETVIKGLKSAWIKVETSLRRQRWKEVLIFFSFLLLSLSLLILQNMNREYETELSIPVRYADIPVDIAFEQELPDKINVHIKDKGSVLLKYSFGRKILPMEVTQKNMTDRQGILYVKQGDIESHIQKALAGTTTIIRVSPQQIEVPFGKQDQKRVPVAFNGSVYPDVGYGVSGRIMISPALVSVYASESLLDSIAEISTVYLEVNNAKKTVTQEIKLKEITGVIFEPATVSVTIPVEEFTEKSLDIPIVCINVPSDYVIRTFPSVVEVRCNVPLSRYRDVSADDFSIQVEFEELDQSTSGMLPLKLTKMPDWVRNYTLTPDRFEFVFEQNRSYD